MILGALPLARSGEPSP